MTTATITRTNTPAAMTLVIGGAVSAVLGVILWVVGASQIGNDQQAADYLHAIGQDNGVSLAATSPALSADQALIAWGIALVVLGVLAVLSWVIIKAARAK
jgi:hypothetical protein